MSKPRLEVLLDLSNSTLTAAAAARYISALGAAQFPDSIAGFCTCVLPPGMTISDLPACAANWRTWEHSAAVKAAEQSLYRAGLNRADWLVLSAPVLIGADQVGLLQEAFLLDPYFGYAMPRVSDTSGTLLELLRPRNDGHRYLSRRGLAELPATYIVADTFSACVLIRHDVTQNIEGLRNDFQTPAGAIMEFLVRARRIGFRGVVCNRAVIARHEGTQPQPAIRLDELHRIDQRYGDAARARQEFAASTIHDREELLAHGFNSGNAAVRTILVDARGVPSGHNGTAEFVFGLLDGVAKVRHDWAITLLVNPGVDTFHDLERRYPQFKVVTSIGSAGLHTLAFRPSQPWHFSTMMELHGIALYNVYVIYDTIAWDTIYPSPRTLQASWEFLAQHADGIAHISDFTRRRFRTRFPSASKDADYVYYPSLDAADYARLIGAPHPSAPYVLIAGNEYDHKDVQPTAAILRTAFPFQKLRIFGRSDENSAVVGSIGTIPQEEIEMSFAGASIVVFPSFYEGFGFPMIRALSYGKTVVVRDSELVRELAALYTGPGRLLAFSSPGDLVEQVGATLHGETGRDLRLGGEIAGRAPLNWEESGRQLLEYLGRVIDRSSACRWQERDRAIRHLLAYSA